MEMIEIKNARPLSVTKKAENIIVGDRIFCALIDPKIFYPVIQVTEHPDQKMRTLHVQHVAMGMMSVAMIYVDDDRRIDTACKFSHNS